jgi:hypothetical protein
LIAEFEIILFRKDRVLKDLVFFVLHINKAEIKTVHLYPFIIYLKNKSEIELPKFEILLLPFAPKS